MRTTSTCLLIGNHGSQMIANLSFLQKGKWHHVQIERTHIGTFFFFFNQATIFALIKRPLDVIKSLLSGFGIGSMLGPFASLILPLFVRNVRGA